MPFVLFLLGAAAVALVASQASAKPSGKGGGNGRSYTLDANLPPQLRAQVLGALQSERDPSKLLAFAAQCAQAGYPLSAAALTQRAMQLGGAPPMPGPQPGPQPQPGPAPGPTPSVNPIDPNQLPDPPRSQVLQALYQGTDPNALNALAQQMDAQGYTFAAQALRLKATALQNLPQPQPAPQPQPGPSPAPTPSPFALDPGMPPAMQSAVLGALTTETDPAKLAAFAQEIQAQYPIAAGLLMTKALALKGQTPGPSPTPVQPQPGPAPIPPMPPKPTPAGALPIGDDSTRTGRNAGRPSGYPFVWLRGTDSTWPAKIAGQATGDEMQYPKMSAINPQFAADGKHWINLRAGDALNIPWEWVPKLLPLYRIAVDPGVTPPVLAAARPAPSLAVRSSTPKGGTNGLATHA